MWSKLEPRKIRFGGTAVGCGAGGVGCTGDLDRVECTEVMGTRLVFDHVPIGWWQGRFAVIAAGSS